MLTKRGGGAVAIGVVDKGEISLHPMFITWFFCLFLYLSFCQVDEPDSQATASKEKCNLPLWCIAGAPGPEA